MRAVEIRNGFGLENLAVTERPDPGDPKPGHLRLRMKAASLNYRDLLTVQGHYNPKQPLPLVPCSDGVGVVEAVGDGVERFTAGDRVLPIFAQGWIAGRPTRERLRSTLGGPLDGTLREVMEVPAESAVAAPEHLSDEAAACLPCAAVTAWSALVADVPDGGVRAGDTVLTLGTGGVSLFALQLGRLLGCRVIVTSSSDEKLSRAAELGADHGINYREVSEWGRAAREATGGRGVDLVVEVGGAGTLEQSLGAVRMGGHIALIGVLSGPRAPLPVTKILMNRVSVQGILVGDRERFEAMNRAIARDGLEPVVDRVFPLGETRRALERMAAGEHFGKIVVRLD